MNEQLWWYVARSGGITALVLTGLAVIWGLMLSTRLMTGAVAPKWLLALHRSLGGLSVAFTGVHMAALMADSYVSFGLTDLFVPLASNWKPGAVAWGIVSMYLLVAVQITSMFMSRIPRRWWKGIHMASWILFWTGLVHGATAGTDSSHLLYVAVTGTMTVLVLFLTGFRILAPRRRPGRERAIGGSGGSAVPAAPGPQL